MTMKIGLHMWEKRRHEMPHMQWKRRHNKTSTRVSTAGTVYNM